MDVFALMRMQAACDAHMNVFLRCIAAAADAPGQGFAAIKVSAKVLRLNLCTACSHPQAVG